MVLNAKDIYLRFLELKDANGDYPSWLNDKEVCKYNSHGDTLYTKQMAIEYIKSVQNSSTCKVFAICFKENDKHIGNISLQNISQKNKNAEFAILLGDKNYWGKGYSKQAGIKILEYGFKEIYIGFIVELVKKISLCKNSHFF